MISRRRFVQSSMLAALVPLVPDLTLAATKQGVAALPARQSWEVFAQGPKLQVLIDAIAAMRANTHSADPNSWFYWVNVHKQYCPHRKAYFLAWHRGLLKRFEGALQRVSGDANLRLPYWNYYASPEAPPEFQAVGSPLWRNNRVSYDVTAALSLTPFGDDVTAFQRGQDNAFETAIETAPHNPIHNLIGGSMSDIRNSPLDPLFWFHHANIDRLWAAWVAAGNGRTMPPETDAYWQGPDLQYGAAVKSMPTVWTYATTSRFLGYTYDDLSLPTQGYPPALARPASQAVQTLAPASTGSGTRLLGGTGRFSLDERSTTFDIPLQAQSASQVRSLMLAPSAHPDATGPLELVLDDVKLTPLGEEGGFYYKVFLNLPKNGVASAREGDFLLGMIGPFEIGVEQMSMRMAHGMPMDGSAAAMGGTGTTTLRFPILGALRKAWPVALDKLSVSFVRVGAPAHRGQAVTVGRMHLEGAQNP